MTYIISATNETLKTLIAKEMKKYGPNCSLNHINVRRVTDMNSVFFNSPFNGDISQWDTSSVTTMDGVFQDSQFNGDISQWDTSSVTTMYGMFENCQFDGDISQWNTSRVTEMRFMFSKSNFNSDINQWDTHNIKYMSGMFSNSKFTGDLRSWNKTETQLKEAFVDSYEGYLEKRRIILEHEQLVDQFQVNGITKKTRSL